MFIPSAMAMPLVAGIDVGAPGWTHHSVAELAVGLALVLGDAGLLVWAIAENAFFEPTVRLQRDRDQQVCTTGPYRLVRHPGYAGALIVYAGVPLVLGSYWTFVPYAVLAVAFVIRTAYEDRMLREELEGYAELVEKTPYQLLPFVW